MNERRGLLLLYNLSSLTLSSYALNILRQYDGVITPARITYETTHMGSAIDTVLKIGSLYLMLDRIGETSLACGPNTSTTSTLESPPINATPQLH
jgi:hypothetical protein